MFKSIKGECGNLTVNSAENYLAFIPFFGGRPPGVKIGPTGPNLKVHSIGQGNSLVKPEIKALQTMATICSCLKYYGQAVVGVTRDQDRDLINQQLSSVVLKDNSTLLKYIHVVQLELGRPAYLPFHLLAWGQQFGMKYILEILYILFHRSN